MKSRLFIILILITTLLPSACTTNKEYTKTNIPKDGLIEVIEDELVLNNEIIEVKVKNHATPIRVISIESDDILLGVNNDGQEVRITIKDIEEAWTRDSLPNSNSSPEFECDGCGPALLLLILIL